MKTKEDHRVRIDVGRLTDVVAKRREVAQGFLYGSEPPPVEKNGKLTLERKNKWMLNCSRYYGNGTLHEEERTTASFKSQKC